MRNFPRNLVLLLNLLIFDVCYPNDGAFKAAGNQLIPVYETDVSVKKEILTIKRISDSKAAITVYYEFFNPKSEKELEVGFEAVSPSGDVDATPVNGRHPYITAFTVNMNDQSIPFKVAIVSDSLYYKNGKYKSKTLASAMKEASENGNYVEFFYVYHFKAVFKPGINIIKHTYTVDLSGSVIENYSLDYILTAAKRWANRQIDDFTLEIDMGEFQDVTIENTFFSMRSEWQLTKGAKSTVLKRDEEIGIVKDASEFFIRKGSLVFQAKNFKPLGELYIHSFNSYYYYHTESDIDTDHFNCKSNDLPFSIESQDQIREPANELSKKILKNLPFARRGYVFKSPELQSYYERQIWYKKDETYQPVLTGLTRKEQDWLRKF